MIIVAKHFSPYPAGRVKDDGPDSGERFRQDFLVPAVKAGGPIEVDIDGTDGYQTSFLEEAFGGLIRNGYISKDELLQRLVIINNDENYKIYKELIYQFIQEA